MPKPDWNEVADAIQRGIWDLKAWSDLAPDQDEATGTPELADFMPSRVGIELTREETIPRLENALIAIRLLEVVDDENRRDPI